MNFSALIDPGTTLGAFTISLIAGILGGVILGFFTGRHYQKKKNNIIEAKTIESDVFQGNKEEAMYSGSITRDERIRNVIKADNVKGTIVQDSPGVVINAKEKQYKSGYD